MGGGATNDYTWSTASVCFSSFYEKKHFFAKKKGVSFESGKFEIRMSKQFTVFSNTTTPRGRRGSSDNWKCVVGIKVGAQLLKIL